MSEKEIILRDTPEESGNGHGNGEGMEDPDEATKRLAEEFSFFGDTKNLSKMTPHLCRQGCKHYDPIGDPESGNFREFCGKSNGTLIERDSVCENYEKKKPGLAEEVLTF